jgi:hypothetical protein
MMPRPQDIQDLMDHAVTVGGVHGIQKTPVAEGVPRAKDDGTLEDGWLSSNIVKKTGAGGKILVSDLPAEVVTLVSGKIANSLLPDTITGKTFQSTGNTTATGYKLADGTDLAAVMKVVVDANMSGVANANVFYGQGVNQGTDSRGKVGTGCQIVPAYLPTLSRSGSTITLTRYINTDCNCNCDCCM